MKSSCNECGGTRDKRGKTGLCKKCYDAFWLKEREKWVCKNCNDKRYRYSLSGLCRKCWFELKRKKKIVKHSAGYRLIHAPNHPNTTSLGRVYEHVFVASKALGRGLKKGEVIHHFNGIKKDNRLKNLLVCTRKYHSWLEHRMAFLYKQEHFGGI